MLKQEAVQTERHMLRAFGFVVHVEHPHRFILNYCQMVLFDTAKHPERCARGLAAAGAVLLGLGWALLLLPSAGCSAASLPLLSLGGPSRPRFARALTLLCPCPSSTLGAARSSSSGCSRRRGIWPTTACARRCV